MVKTLQEALKELSETSLRDFSQVLINKEADAHRQSNKADLLSHQAYLVKMTRDSHQQAYKEHKIAHQMLNKVADMATIEHGWVDPQLKQTIMHHEDMMRKHKTRLAWFGI